VAYDSARVLKQRHPKHIVEIRVRATGERIVMRETATARFHQSSCWRSR
jgi:hypothetical protein